MHAAFWLFTWSPWPGNLRVQWRCRCVWSMEKMEITPLGEYLHEISIRFLESHCHQPKWPYVGAHTYMGHFLQVHKSNVPGGKHSERSGGRYLSKCFEGSHSHKTRFQMETSCVFALKILLSFEEDYYTFSKKKFQFILCLDNGCPNYLCFEYYPFPDGSHR